MNLNLPLKASDIEALIPVKAVHEGPTRDTISVLQAQIAKALDPDVLALIKAEFDASCPISRDEFEKLVKDHIEELKGKGFIDVHEYDKVSDTLGINYIAIGL